MKTQILSIEGKKTKEIELPKVFSSRIREDILKKVFEAEKTMQPYGPNPKSGRRHSASGIARHKRHAWKSGYGHGRSRIPRKIMWRRGNQFYWVGAEVSGTRGGRKAHAPNPIKNLFKKINKKEFDKAMNSAIASTAKKELVEKRYGKIEEIKETLPLIVESKLISLKTKEILNSVNNLLGNMKLSGEKKRTIRSGKGKSRNRRYKVSQGVLIITGNKEEIKTKAVDHCKIEELSISDLYPAGRLVIYTENAIKELGGEK